MRGTTFTKGKMNYFGSFSQQRTWAPLAQGADDGLLLISILMANGYCARSLTLQGRMHGKLQTDLPVRLQSLSNFQMGLPDLSYPPFGDRHRRPQSLRLRNKFEFRVIPTLAFLTILARPFLRSISALPSGSAESLSPTHPPRDLCKNPRHALHVFVRRYSFFSFLFPYPITVIDLKEIQDDIKHRR